MDKLKVAIIDDGINDNHFSSNRCWVVDDQNHIVSDNNQVQNDSHGNLCFKIISKYLGKTDIDVCWYSIRIFDTKLICSIDKLIAALGFCFDNNITLVHLSLGTTQVYDHDILKEIIKKCVDQGMIIVSACSNNGEATYPACYTNVLGVKSSPELHDDQYLPNKMFDFDGVDYLASSKHVLRINGRIIVTTQSNSYAAPVLTSRIISYLLSKPNASLLDIKTALDNSLLENTQDNASIVKNYSALFLQWCEANKKLITIGKQKSIPILFFCGYQNYRLITLLQFLKKRFEYEGYFCKVIVDNIILNNDSFLQQFDILDTIPVKEYSNYAAGYWNYDILLVGIFDNNAQTQHADIIINNDKIQVLDKNKEKHNSSCIQNDDVHLFHSLLSLLTDSF